MNEVMYMQKPFIAIKTAENQDDMYQYLKKRNYMILNKFNDEDLQKYLKKIIG